MTDLKSVLHSLQPVKKKKTKNCKRCGAESRRLSAKSCSACGKLFPQCVVCGKALQDGDIYCPGCGIAYCSYY